MALAMTWGTITLACYGAGAAAIATSLVAMRRRLELSQAKHRSIAGHSRVARRLAAFVPFYEYDERQFFCSDGAPDDVVARRRAGFEQLGALYKSRFAETGRRTAEASEYIPDLQFTGAYRMPFQYRRMVRANLPVGAFLQSADGVTVTDLDGNRFYDLAGSYGVNILGYDFYKDAIERGVARVRDLGPLLGSYHPVVLDNVKRLREISGLDEVSFHMSGTEAVMQAVRLARYHTRRTHLVRFCGAYHGWWGDVQPGIGNPLPAHETYTLRDMSEESLRVLRTRRDIACVLVNPEQALHPNGPAPNNSALVDSARSSHFDKDAYAVWLKRLRQVCTEQNIVLIIDEIFVGFRLAAGGAQDYFDVPGRPCHLRQDARWRLAGRRRLRAQGPDETVPRRSAGRHLLCPRHIQLAPLRHGSDERVSAAACDTADTGALSWARRNLERAGAAVEPAAFRRRLAGSGCEHVLAVRRLLHPAVAL